jgi:tape measure domain-containing protein
MATVGNINVAITASTRGLDKGLADAQRKMKTFGQKQQKLGNAAGGRGAGGGGGGKAKTRGGVGGFGVGRGLIGAAAGALGIRQLAAAADEWTMLNNRVKLFTKTTKEQEQQVEALFAVAKRSRADVGAVADVFQKFALVNVPLGIANEETNRMVETLAKLGVIGGQSTEAIAQGLRQLGQGFGKNKLDGDELKSVIENILPVAQVLAKEMNLANVAGLQGDKGAGAKGLLTQTFIMKALANAVDETDRKFAALDVTISQHTQNVSNKFIRMIGKINEATGATRKFGLAAKELADSFDFISDFVDKPSLAAAKTLDARLFNNPLLRTLAGGPAALGASAFEFIVRGDKFFDSQFEGEVKESNSSAILTATQRNAAATERLFGVISLRDDPLGGAKFSP